ncbi:hypothetical protein ADUPG1_006598 [Aduncisulcus paluster]|uniref:Uncharacterized protein n=1 Tax=Aduncisulcus paluster TaxID=2918883 RepID=A0ABQ5KIT9_9EUKA|nr:hypothetical protein ADUPG1_006598 [Aduncisulcus paluster]
MREYLNMIASSKKSIKWNGKKRGLDTVMDEVKRPRWSGVFVNKASALSRSSSTIGMISSSVDSTGLGAASGSVPRNSTLDNALKYTMASIESPLFLPSPPLVSHHSHEVKNAFFQAGGSIGRLF